MLPEFLSPNAIGAFVMVEKNAPLISNRAVLVAEFSEVASAHKEPLPGPNGFRVSVQQGALAELPVTLINVA